MAFDATEVGLISLFRALEPEDDDADLSQIPDLASQTVSPNAGLKNLAVAVDLSSRRDRYAANLGYVLARRCIDRDIHVQDDQVALGQKIVGRFNPRDLDVSERSLDSAVKAMMDATRQNPPVPQVTTDVADMLVGAFGDSLEYTDLGDSIRFRGAAAETATMLSEMSCMDFEVGLSSNKGTVKVLGKNVDVVKFDYEFCTQATWKQLMVTVDPQQWHTYNPLFFHFVHVLNQVVTGAGPGWTGLIQESAGINPNTGDPALTNLTVTYHAQPDVVVTAFDLGPDIQGAADDATVTVDYGFFGVTNEGAHRRMRMVKVLHIDGFEKWPKWIWSLMDWRFQFSGWLVDP